jgi:hypothetical protein
MRLEYLFPDGGATSEMGSGIALIPENLNAAFQIDGTSVFGHLEYQLKPGQSGGLGIAWQPMTLPRRAESERPAGQWNEIEIRYEGAKLTFGLNGTVVNQAVLEQYWPCHIALLAQQSDVRFRNLRIIPMKTERRPGSGNAESRAEDLRDASPPQGIPFRLINLKTGKALDVKDGSMRAGAALVQSLVSPERPSQSWTVRSAQGSLLIINAQSGHSINIPRTSNNNHEPLIQWTVAEGELNQCWVFRRDKQAFRIASCRNNLVIAALDTPNADGPIVQLFPTGGNEELWQVVSAGR